MSGGQSTLVLEDVSQASEDPFAALNALLRAYNNSNVGPANHIPLWLFARDAAGRVQGGLRGGTHWQWCAVEVLVVAEPYRRQGIGTQLLARAERVARERSCAGIYLDSVSFQAPEFYLRLGYVEFGRIEGFPPGHTRHWLMKRL